MTIRKSILISLILCVPVSNILSQQLSKINEKTMTLTTDIPDNTCLSINNPTDTLSVFSIRFNNNFYSTPADITADISEMAGTTKDSLFFYAWKFIARSTYSNELPFEEKWSPSLLLYLNSLGTGQSRKHALMLSKTWELMGYKTRVWDLNGHVVPEVSFNDKWLMLDAMYPLYFTNNNNEIAGAEELMKNPDIITNKERIRSQYPSSYIKCLRDIKYYKSVDDNKVITDNSSVADVDTFLLQLPPHASLSFPGIFTKKTFSKDSSNTPYYANCRLTIPPSWTGPVKNYLIIADIQGKGSLVINKNDYDIGSKELDSLISNNHSFISEIYVTGITDTLKIIYFINPIYSLVKKENTLLLKGKNIDMLQEKLIVLPDSISAAVQLKKQYFNYFGLRTDFLTEELSVNNRCIENTDIDNKFHLLAQFNRYLECIYSNGNDVYIKEVTGNLNNMMNDLPKNVSLDNLFFIINYIPHALFFYDLEHSPYKTTYNFLSNLMLKKLK